MHAIALAAALAGLLLPAAMAAPVVDGTAQYEWTVTKFQFSRGQEEYDYSFSVSGPQDGTVPGFTASCSGPAQNGFQPCSILPVGGHSSVPTVLANVKIVQDPSNPDDNIPRVVVRETWSDKKGCSYQQTGHYDKSGFNQPVGSKKGSRFIIIPGHAKAVC
jgi:hypothetical protein